MLGRAQVLTDDRQGYEKSYSKIGLDQSKKHLQHSAQTLTLDSNSSYSTLQGICPQVSHLSSLSTNPLIYKESELFL